jgi:Flp pilus assembly protein TadD
LTRAIGDRGGSFESHTMLANLYAGRGDLAAAQRTLEQYIARHGDVASARTALGIVLEAANHPREARAAYEQALALDPIDPVAANNLARIYASDDAQVSRALELAQTAASRLPNDADAHDTLGWIAFRAGRLSLAASALERAVALNGREPTYQDHLRAVRTAIDEAAKADAEAEAARGRKSEQ